MAALTPVDMVWGEALVVADGVEEITAEVLATGDVILVLVGFAGATAGMSELCQRSSIRGA